MATNMFGDEELGSSAKSTNVFGDEEVQVEKPGFFTSVKRGLKGFQGGLEAARAEGSSDMLGKLERLEREGDSPAVQAMAEQDLLFANHYNRWKLAKGDPAVLQELKAGELARGGKALGGVQQRAQEAVLLPASEETRRFQQSEGFGESVKNLAAAPFTIIKETVGESLGTQAATLPMTIGLGLAAGPAGLAAGSGAGSFLAEYGSGTLELLQQSGIDLNDTAAVSRFLASPQFKAVQAEKIKKAAVIGAVDAATAGVVGVKLGSTAVKNLAAQTGVQMAGGAVGEIAGSKAAGEEINHPAWISEMIGEVPGAGIDVATMAGRKVLTAKAKVAVANELEKEVVTGLNTEQQKVADTVVGATPKPRLNTLQVKVAQAAAAAGLDPMEALVIAQIESGTNPNAKNPASTAHGIFQQLDSTWAAHGGGDRSNVDQQIANGLAGIAATRAQLEKALGRQPDAADLYTGHLLGVRGAAIALNEAQSDPQGSFLETVKSWDKKNAEAIVKNNGLEGLTNEQAMHKIAAKVGKTRMALGLDDAMNVKTHARGDMPPVEDVTGETQDAIDAGMVDLETMFAELEDVTVTPELLQAAELEETAEKSQTNPGAAADAAVLNGGEPTIETSVTNEIVEPAEAERLRAESWVSIDENQGRKNYENPNDLFKGRIHKAPIVAGADGYEGTTLESRPIAPGEVIAVGVDSEHTPLEVMQGTQQALQDVIARYAPTARVALTFQSEADDVVSSFGEPEARSGYGVRNRQNRTHGLYRINMRNLTNFGRTDSGSANTTTQRKFTYGMYHEAGHVITAEMMVRDMQPALRAKFENLKSDEFFSPEELATLDPERAAVLQEYNELKWQVLNNPNFTAESFAYAWFSPWKLSHALGYSNTPGVFAFVKKFLGEATVQKLQGPARALALAMEASVPEVLTPHEYMAEQFARYAYTNKLAEHSSLGSFQFFKRALATMRDFFQRLKRGGEIKPGIAFAEWVDSLTATAEHLHENKALPELPQLREPAKPLVKRKAKSRVKTPTLADAPSVLPPSPVRAEEVTKIVTKEYSADQNEALMLLASKGMRELAKEDPKKYDHWMQLIRKDRLDDLKADLALYIDEDFVREKVRFDRDIPEQQEWQEIELGLGQVLGKKSGALGWLRAGLRRLSAAQWYTWTSRQIAAKYIDVAGVQVFDKLHTNFKAFKAQLELPGVEAAQKWTKLGKEQDGLMQQAMREEHAAGEHFAELTKVNGSWRFVANERLAEYAKRKGLEPETVEVWLAAKNAHLLHMNTLRNVLLLKAQQRLKGKPQTFMKKAAEINQLFESIRNTPFLPQTRFGEYAVHVKEPGTDGDSIVHVEFFESEIARNEGLEKLKKAAGANRKVVAANYNTTSGILRTLPPQLLGTWGDELELTSEEKKELRQIADAITLNPQLRKYSAQLAGITGANKDLQRNFAEFMWHNANNIARVHYREHFQKAILQIEADKMVAGAEGEIAAHDELTKLVAFYKRRMGHVLNPVDEWQAVRAFVVVKQLWGQIKTALANLTALKDVWATAAAQQGFVRGTGATSVAAAKAFADSMQKTGQRIMRQPVEGGQVFDADTRWALDQAYQDGLISETFAAQLGTMANNGLLARLGYPRLDRGLKQAIWIGMLPQHLIETYVRRVSLVTQFEFYRKQGMRREDAYGRARKDTFLTQGDNTLSNRPEIALGKAANFLIYFGFLQNQWYLLSGAKERARNFTEAYERGDTQGMTRAEAKAKFYKTHWGGETLKTWMAYAFLGGAMGMPGAEDLDNTLELIAKKLFGTRFSLKEHAYELANAIAANAGSLGLDVNPRSLVHGTMADFDAFGLLPAVDLSPSTGLGNAVPGLGGLGDAGQRNGNFVLGMMGPLGGVLQQFNDVFSDDPGMLKKLGFFLPNVATGIAKTIGDWEHGVQAPNGGRITIDRETGEVRDLTTGEQLARLMNFNPEIIAANREVHWMQRDQQQYWSTRRNGLVKAMFEAARHDDREAIADVQEEIRLFNESAPRALGISGKELRGALRRKAKAAARQEAGLGSKRFRETDAELRRNVMGEEE